MALSSRRRDRGGLDAWPGYVDALSTLLMVIIFVLLVFVLAQGFLGAALNSRDQALEAARRQVAELAEMLSLERTQAAELRNEASALRMTLGRLQAELRETATARDRLTVDLSTALANAARLTTERDAGLARIGTLERGEREATTRADRSAAEAAALAQQLAAMRAELERLNQNVRADRATIEARLAELAQLSEQIRALTALRTQLERELREAGAARQAAESETAQLSERARAQVALLTQEIEALRAQLARIAAALELAETRGRDKDAQIANLGQRLNLALAAQVEALQRYRSDFFGRLREVLGNRPEIRVVGDRFVFQSEVLFPPGSADLSDRGAAQIRQLGRVLREIAGRIPPDVNWVLRIDGHADRTPISNQRFASNWELSAARSIAVARLLVGEGVPATRVAPTAFGDNQPLDPAEGPAAFARNRRIEFRLTDR